MNSNERHLGVQSATSTDGAPHASGGEVLESSRITADSRCSDRAVSHKTVIRKDSSATERKGESTGLEWEGAAAKSEESLVGQPTPGLSPAKGSRPDREVLSSLTMRNTKSLATTTFASGAATAGQVLPNHGERKLGNQTTEKSIKSLETTKPQITSSSREPLESNISQQTKPFQTIQVTPTAFTGTVSTVSDERNRGNSRKSDNIAHQVPGSFLAMQLAMVPVPVAVANSNVGRSSCVGISTNDTAKEQSKEAIVLQSNPKPQQLPVSPFQPMTQFSPKSKAMSLRRGKWTAEEEAYVARVIQDFNSGFLNAPAGTTLRTYLSDKLHCDPMRITKKFTGEACIGKRVFHPAVRCPSSAPSIDRAQAELDALERRWRRRLEMQQRESAKKAAASSAAASIASVSMVNRGHIPGTLGIIAPPASNQEHMTQSVARTASWLDRANAILSNPDVAAVPKQILPPIAIEHQLQEVERLLHEGPSIQQTTAGLPHLLEKKASVSTVQTTKPHSDQGIPPLEKRRKVSGAEDAEALVGFVNSVRASAAAAAATRSPGVK